MDASWCRYPAQLGPTFHRQSDSGGREDAAGSFGEFDEAAKCIRKPHVLDCPHVHVAPSTSFERIRSLRERGVIRGYHAEVDLAALGRDVQALIAIRIRPPSRENIEAFRDWAHQLPESIGVFVVSGGDDFLLHVALPSTDALYAFVIDRLTERPEVADVHTSVVYEHLRSHVVEPLR